MRIKRLILTVILSANILFLMAADYRSVFSEGVNLYNQGNFSGAEEKWMSLYKDGYKSPDLLYNIGNACYKQDKLSGAILFYERALLLKPSGDDIIYNLQIARTRLTDRFREVPRPFFAEWYDIASLSLSTNTWAIFSLSLFLLLIACLVFFFLTTSQRIRITSFWLIIVLVLLSGITFAFSKRNSHLLNNNNYAVVLSGTLTGKSSPDEGGSELFVLHEGTKVQAGESVGEYTEVELPDGNKGWVETDGIEKI